MQQTRDPSFGVARIIAVALPLGVTIFWVVGWFLTGGGRAGVAPEALSPTLALTIWAAVAMSGFAAALAFRARALGAARALRGVSTRDAPAPGLGALQTNLILAWALLEAPALLSGVFFLLTGVVAILLFAVPVYLVGVALTFPRAEWFGETRSRSGRG